MEENKYFVKRLEKAIGEVSVRSFARKAGVSDSALRQYLSGRSEPTRPALIKLAKAADVNLSWLIAGTGRQELGVIELSWVDLPSYIRSIFIDNRRRGRGKNTDCVFLAGLDDGHCDQLEQFAINAAKKDNRLHVVVEAKEKTRIQIAKKLTGEDCRTNLDADNNIEKFIIENDQVIIFRNISKSKVTHKSYFLRGLAKILDDGHFASTEPASDLVFIDISSFLEKAWEDIGAYIRTNIATGSVYR